MLVSSILVDPKRHCAMERSNVTSDYLSTKLNTICCYPHLSWYNNYIAPHGKLASSDWPQWKPNATVINSLFDYPFTHL